MITVTSKKKKSPTQVQNEMQELALKVLQRKFI